MKIHFVGCEGASMKALMEIARAGGAEVSGSDLLLGGHKAEFAAGADTVVYTCAVSDDNPELVYAREHGITLLSRAEYLGQIARGYDFTAAIAGSHGKTTVTAMLGCIAEGIDPTVHLGGVYRGERVRVGGKKLFITEACEYKRNFLHLLPTSATVLNVELDHTDYYRDLDDITSAFDVFSSSAKIRILNGDDNASKPLCHGKFVTFGLGEGNDYRAKNIALDRNGASFTLTFRERMLGEIKLKVRGKHNVCNALAAAATAMQAGFGFGEVKRGLESFEGVSRRLEYLGRTQGCEIFTDYAHHPHEIASTLDCLYSSGYERVGIIFEPHTYSRTLSLLDDFAAVLTKADEILLAEIYPAREAPIKGVSSQVLCRRILDSGRYARVYDSYCELNRAANKICSKCDALVYCGAGTIDVAARKLKN